MIEFGDNLYPINNIKNIKIDRENLTLIIYFLDGLKILPATLVFKDKNKFERKVEELSGKKKSLLG